MDLRWGPQCAPVQEEEPPRVSAVLCWGCKAVAPIVYTDELDRGFCEACYVAQPVPREALLAAWVAANPPFDVGDKVECRTGAQVYDGIGVVAEVSTDPKDLATPIVPMFRVVIEEKSYPEVPDEVWYSGICLSKVDA